jgi:hypothetical protein
MASADGWFYMFDVNMQEGGICKLLTQASIYTSNPAIFTNNSIGNTIVNNTNNFNNMNNNDDNNHHQYHLQQQQQQHQQQQQQNNYHQHHQQSYENNQFNDPNLTN